MENEKEINNSERKTRMPKMLLTIIRLSVAFISFIVTSQVAYAMENKDGDEGMQPKNAVICWLKEESGKGKEPEEYIRRYYLEYESTPNNFELISPEVPVKKVIEILRPSANERVIHRIFLGGKREKYKRETLKFILQFKKKGLLSDWNSYNSKIFDPSFCPPLKTPLPVDLIIRTCRKLEVNLSLKFFKDVRQFPQAMHKKAYKTFVAFFQSPTETELSLPHQVHTIESHSNGFELSLLPSENYNNLDSESESIDKIELKESQNDTKIIMSDSNDTEKDDGSGNGTGRGGKLFVYYRDPSFIHSVYMKKRKRSQSHRLVIEEDN